MKKKVLITAAIMAGVLFNNAIYCCAAIDPSKMPTSLASSVGQRKVEVPTSLAETVEKPVVNNNMNTAAVPSVANEEAVVNSTMKRIHLTAEKNGSVESIVEGLKKQAVTHVINDLKQQQSEYSSDFQDVIGNYNEYIIAVHIVDRNKLFVKIDVRAAALKEIIDSKFVRNTTKIPVAPDPVAGELAQKENGDNANHQLINNGEQASDDNRNALTLVPRSDEVCQTQPSEVREVTSGNKAGEQVEKRHKWAQNI